MGQSKEITYEINDRGCHICTSHFVRPDGYIFVKRNGRKVPLHRWLYSQFVDHVPDDLVVRHKCDNRACINLDHLETGTHQDNSDDKYARGRAKTSDQTGSKNGNAALDEDTVRAIRADKVSTNKALALKYGVTHSTISSIRRGISWTHVK